MLAVSELRNLRVELRDLLISSVVDVLTAQELKLRMRNKTPFIERYVIVQKDRNNFLGGGLLLFMRTGIILENLHLFEKIGMEILPIRIKNY